MKGVVLDDVALLISETDTVATAITDLSAGHVVATDSENAVTLEDDVPFGHKFAIEPIREGQTVYKYGEVIGSAVTDIDPGAWVHTHNCESTRGRGDKAAASAGGDRGAE